MTFHVNLNISPGMKFVELPSVECREKMARVKAAMLFDYKLGILSYLRKLLKFKL